MAFWRVHTACIVAFSARTTVAFRSSLLYSSSRSSMMSSSALSATREFNFGTPPSSKASATILIGKRSTLENNKSAILAQLMTDMPFDETTIYSSMVESISGTSGTASTFVTKDHQLHMGIIPPTVSRNNHPLSVHSITDMIAKLSKSGKTEHLVFVDSSQESIDALTIATAKAFPLYTRKKTDEASSVMHVSFCDDAGAMVTVDNPAQLNSLADGVRLAGRLMDMTPEELTTTAFAQECRELANRLEGVSMTEIVGQELKEKGYGGIYGVGKAAVEPPRLVILEYNPKVDEPTETVALVGKGIVYDTGGLALKPKTGMCGMKHDMGGAAGMLGGFCAAVQRKVSKRIVLLLCLAENAIGNAAFRNDDILTLYSGKTVEINNSDAEGRLVLGDGVAHATKHIENLDLVVDMATLTGAQLVATGKKHAGILANSVELEQRAIKAGMASGDLVYPLVYCPELLMKEFDSKVATMKNSVKDRGNAQSSCAGHFVESHLDESYDKGWLHIDMAGPGSKDERGTGYGVGLILSLMEDDSP